MLNNWSDATPKDAELDLSEGVQMSNENSDQDATAIEFMIARNGVLDAFSTLESEISRFIGGGGKAATRNLALGQKLEAFRKVKANPQAATANLPKVEKIADSIACILPIRADIVHSQMKLKNLDGTQVAVFANSVEATEPYPLVRILELKQLMSVGQTALMLTGRIKQLGQKEGANPVSSLPPPLPGAAVDP